MAYLCKNGEKRERIKDYIRTYTTEHGTSPSMREIAAGTGISRAMVQRYMAAMRDGGDLSYSRRNTSAELGFSVSADSVSVPFYGPVAGDMPGEEQSFFGFPRSFVGEGEFCLLGVTDNAMEGDGIRAGDTVLVRLCETFSDGDIAVVETEKETLIRRVYERAGGLLVRAANPQYGDTLLRQGRVRGTVTYVLSSKEDIKEDNQSGDRSALQVFLL